MPRTKHPSEEVFHSLVGDYPLDAIAPLNTALDALHQLEAILKSIAKEAAGECDSRRLEHLGDAGVERWSGQAQVVGEVAVLGEMEELHVAPLVSIAYPSSLIARSSNRPARSCVLP